MMRGHLIIAMTFGAVSAAQAADMPDLPVLRGSFPAGLSTATRNWDGWYAGGQVGYSSANIDFSRSIVGLTNSVFRNSVLQEPTSTWSVLDKNVAQASGFGAFVGRNYQYDDLVFSLEANYNYLNNLASSSSRSISRSIVNPPGDNPPAGHTHTYDLTLTGAAALQVKDVITFRGRAGWAYENFLPYMFGGLAVGRMDVARSVLTTGTLLDDYNLTTTAIVGGVTITNTVPQQDRYTLQPQGAKEERVNSFVAGWTLGLGMEYMLWNCLFLRGEYEYIKFLSVKDTVVGMNNLRAGIGYKF
jgi:outer membrane immunogenic protein